jgi:hypothetical protein
MNNLPVEKIQLTEKHHAILFALLAREVIICLGVEEGKDLVRQVVRFYGEQRGKRMALRALRDGQPLTMANFRRYGEWRSLTSEGRSETVLKGMDIVTNVSVCPWANAWFDTELLPYGRLYCQEIDRALVRGFNPELTIHVNSTISNDSQPCEFIYVQAVPSSELNLESGDDESGRHEPDMVMPWEYHCGHLYKTFYTLITEKFAEEGKIAVECGLQKFEAVSSISAAECILGYLSVDFTKLPDQN